MAKGEIRVDLVADASSLERAMKKADMAAGKFEHSQRDLNDTMEKSQTQARGTADLLDGLATTMGFNLDGAIQMSRGFADLADGIKTTVIPAIKASTAAIKAQSRALLASPWGRAAVAVAALGAVTVASTQDQIDWTDQLHRAEGAAKDFAGWTQGVSLKVWGKLDDAIGGNGKKLLGWMGITDGAKKKTEALAVAAAQAAQALQLAMQFGGSLTDPDGAFAGQAALADPDFLRSLDPVFIKQSLESDFTATTKAVESHVKKVSTAAADAMKKVQPQLDAAVKKFADAVSMRDAFKDSFKLGFGDDIGHNVTESLRRQVDTFKAFVKKIASLRKMGLNEGLVRDFADAGPAALDEMNRIDSGNIGLINDLAKQAGKSRDQFSNSETMRRTGVDPSKAVKVTLDIKGGDTDLKNMIKKWVRTDGGGNVQVAFR